jgi:hypothetical protein
MAKMQDVYLYWKDFGQWVEVLDSTEHGFPSVYAVVDGDGNPHYLGSAPKLRRRTQKGGIYAGGIRQRYISSAGALKASIHETKNKIYVASAWSKPSEQWAKVIDEWNPIDPDPIDVELVEDTLLFDAKQKGLFLYNDPHTIPKTRPLLNVHHLGNPPKCFVN